MRKLRIIVINGPNLNLLGRREPDLYGSQTLADIEDMMRAAAQEMDVDLEFFQSNHEGELVEAIHNAAAHCHGIIINAGAYSHYSLAIADALRAVDLPAVEVHLTNVYAREEIRHRSVLGPATIGGIYGLGPLGYTLALAALASLMGGDDIGETH